MMYNSTIYYVLLYFHYILLYLTMKFIGNLILAIIVSLVIYIYQGYNNGFGRVNSEIFKFISEHPFLAILLLYSIVVLLIEKEKRYTWILLTLVSGIILVVTAIILYFKDVHGYNDKLITYGVGLIMSAIFMGVFSSGYKYENSKRDYRITCPNCSKKISSSNIKCPYCRTDI